MILTVWFKQNIDIDLMKKLEMLGEPYQVLNNEQEGRLIFQNIILKGLILNFTALNDS